MYREAPGESAPLVIVAFNGYVYALERESGNIFWKNELTSSGGPVELVIDRDIIVACDGYALVFIDYATGTLRKRIARKDVARAARPVILPTGPHFIIGGNGEAACYTRDGELVWEQGFPGQGFGSVSLGVPGRVRQADSER